MGDGDQRRPDYRGPVSADTMKPDKNMLTGVAGGTAVAQFFNFVMASDVSRDEYLKAFYNVAAICGALVLIASVRLVLTWLHKQTEGLDD